MGSFNKRSMKGDKNKLISINIDKIKEQKDIKLLLQLLRLQDEETYNHCVRVANIVYDIINIFLGNTTFYNYFPLFIY